MYIGKLLLVLLSLSFIQYIDAQFECQCHCCKGGFRCEATLVGKYNLNACGTCTSECRSKHEECPQPGETGSLTARCQNVPADEVPIPETEEDPVPETEEDPVPETGEEDPVPEAGEEDPVPEAGEEDPVPETEENPVPETEEDPVPETEEDPVPETEEDPVPETGEEDPVPETEEDPVPKNDEDPVPKSDEEPVEGENPVAENEEDHIKILVYTDDTCTTLVSDYQIPNTNSCTPIQYENETMYVKGICQSDAPTVYTCTDDTCETCEAVNINSGQCGGGFGAFSSAKYDCLLDDKDDDDDNDDGSSSLKIESLSFFSIILMFISVCISLR